MLAEVVLEVPESEADEFTVSYWKIDVGASVSEGDEIVVLESVGEKTALAVRSPFSGTLHSIVTGEESTVRPGNVLCRMEVG